MYQNDTILTLKTPRWRPLIDGEPGDWTDKDYDTFALEVAEDPTVGEEFPYNRVRVVGPSPIVHQDREGHGAWVGTNANGVIIQPIAGFDSNVDYPLGFIQSRYDIESVPEVADPQDMAYGLPRRYTRVDLSQTGLPTPEEVFAKEAPPTGDERPSRKVADPLGVQAEIDAAATRVGGPLGDL